MSNPYAAALPNPQRDRSGSSQFDTRDLVRWAVEQSRKFGLGELSNTTTAANIASGAAALVCGDYDPAQLIATVPPWEQANRQVALQHPQFNKLLTRLKRLYEYAEDEDADMPTKYAFQATLELLYATFSEMLGEKVLHQKHPHSHIVQFPLAAASADQEGGLHLYWRGPDRNVHITVPGSEDGNAFLYYSASDEYDVEKPLTPQLLARWLEWYINA